MCDRTRAEILARNFAFEYYQGAIDNGLFNNHPGIKASDMADEHWKRWRLTALKILEVLDKHDD